MRQILIILLVSYTYSQSINNYYIRQDSVFIGDLINYVIELENHQKLYLNKIPYKL